MRREDLSEQGREGRVGGETKNNEFSNRKLIYSLQFQFSFQEGPFSNGNAKIHPHKHRVQIPESVLCSN